MGSRALLVVGAALLLGATPGRAAPPARDGAAVPPASAPSRRPAATPPPSTRDLGTAHPTAVEAADPDGRWVVLCQARRDTDGDGRIGVGLGPHGDFYGDRMEPYLVLRDGPGEPLDSFIAAAPGGRHLAFVARGRLVLLDVRNGRRTDLSGRGGRGADDGFALGPHPGASFSPDGSRLLYVRGAGPRARVVLRDLAAGRERIVDHGGGTLWRAAFTTGGWISVWVRPPGERMVLPRTTLSGRRCRGPVASYSTFGVGGPGPVHRLVPVAGGAATRLDGLLAAVGASVLRRREDGALVWERGGRAAVAVPAACGARLLAFERERGPLLVACDRQGRPAPLVWFGPRAPRALGLTVPAADGEAPHQSEVWVHWRDQVSDLVHIETGTRATLGVETEAVVTYGRRTYLHRAEYAGHHAAWDGFIDWPSGAVTTLPRRLPKYPRTVRGGAWLATQPEDGPGLVVDLEGGTVAGGLDRDPLAITRDGWVLLANESRFARPVGPPYPGPLRWHAPTALPPSRGGR